MGKPLDLHERALRLLSVRPRSRRELERRLVRAGFEPTEVREELERLEAVGLVDDRAFAQQVLEHELAVRGSGRRAIVSRLAAKGVDRATIESTLADLPAEADEDRAGELALGRLPRLAGLPREQAYARLTGFLARRGYDADVARRAARRALEVGSEP
ncbi:MAG TPA: regulatory protein RecX [Actinomycetota bacterium]|jgi:regulatory protein